MPVKRALAIGSLVVGAALVVSGVKPYDRATWLLEVFPVLIAFPVMWATARRFPLTDLLYVLIAIHALILIAGGAYTYARVPLGFHLQDVLHTTRNPYDKIGHLAQGFIPVLVAREILIRGSYVQGRRMLAFVCVCIVMFISSSYELLEWATALAMGQGADEFLGTQGDPWDTQSDMFCALIGSIVSLLLLSRLHDRQLERLRA